VCRSSCIICSVITHGVQHPSCATKLYRHLSMRYATAPLPEYYLTMAPIRARVVRSPSVSLVGGTNLLLNCTRSTTYHLGSVSFVDATFSPYYIMQWSTLTFFERLPFQSVHLDDAFCHHNFSYITYEHKVISDHWYLGLQEL